MGVVKSSQETGMKENPFKEWNGRLDAVNLVFSERPEHPLDGLFSCLSPGDELGK